MIAFTVNDTLMKMLSEQWPLYQSIFVRGLGAVFLMLGLAAALGQLRVRPSRRDWRLIAARSACEAAAAFFFISAIFNMPIGEATAILQTLPLTVALAGALFLGEAIGWRRLLSIAVGFVGVLLIVRPGGEAFTVYSLYALAAVFAVTLRDIASRRMSKDIPSLFAATISATCVATLGAVGSLTEDWAPMTWSAAFILGGTMGSILLAYVFSVSAMRSGEIGFVSPFRYTAVVFALLSGVLIFGERPDALTITGAFIIVATGLFTMYREALASRHKARGIVAHATVDSGSDSS